MAKLFFLSLVFASLFFQIASAYPSDDIRNVLFIISDDLKASVLGCYGDPVCKTPHIDALARRSVVFERAYCNATWCAPSRQSMMFSRYLHAGKIGSDTGQVNLGEHLRNSGIHSARVGKIYHMRVPGDIIAGTDGNDVPSSWNEKYNTQGKEAHTDGQYACLNQNVFTREQTNRQSTAMPHRMFVTVKQDGNGSKQPDYQAASKAIELLNQHKDKPFFLAVGMVRPHYPNVAPAKYFDLYPWQKINMPRIIPGDLDDIPKLGMGQTRSDKNPIGKYPDNQKRMWSGYYATVSFMDEQVGRILKELGRLGLAENTAIIFTSDHGYHLGEHMFWQKLNLHEEVARVPLIISVPGIKPGRTSSFAELVDLYPTISELIARTPIHNIHGKSLIPIVRNPEAKVREAALTYHRGHLLRTDRWAYMRYKDGSEELYDMENDPGQFTNLAFGEERRMHQSELEILAAKLDDRLKKTKSSK